MISVITLEDGSRWLISKMKMEDVREEFWTETQAEGVTDSLYDKFRGTYLDRVFWDVSSIKNQRGSHMDAVYAMRSEEIPYQGRIGLTLNDSRVVSFNESRIIHSEVFRDVS